MTLQGRCMKEKSSLDMSHFVSGRGRRNLVDWDAVIRLQPINKAHLRRTTWSGRGRRRCGGQPSVAFAGTHCGERLAAEVVPQLMGGTQARESAYVHLDLPISAKRAAGDVLRLTASLIHDIAPQQHNQQKANAQLLQAI